jgi:peptide/nickel transport system ATP-binding protein
MHEPRRSGIQTRAYPVPIPGVQMTEALMHEDPDAATRVGGAPTLDAPLLQIENLSIDAGAPAQSVRLVDGFGLNMAAGDRLALVGESGSGKSVTARAVMRLDPSLRVSGSVRIRGEELLDLPEKAMRKIRGHTIGMVFQDPMSALNPLMTIGANVMEPLRAGGMNRKAARTRTVELLGDLGVVNASQRMDAYPHEFSGGMRQRVVMAMALAREPELLIADEPTTALDVRVQDQVLKLLDEVSAARSLAVLLITHDLGIVAGFADRVAVMYGGRKVHEDTVDRIFESPSHPYTQSLLEAVPRIDAPPGRLRAIPGSPPRPASRPDGCAFHPRCAQAIDICRTTVPELQATADGGAVACHVAADAGSTKDAE